MLFTVLMFFVVLGILVIVHELGHFLAAKSIGVRVEKFSIGFWPKLFGVTFGETEYLVSLLPWGGYVKISGQEEPEGEEPEHYELCSRSKLQRLYVYIAGPFANLALAVALFPLIYMFGISVPSYIDQPATIGWVQKDSPAAGAGIETGDTIIEVMGNTTPTWEAALTEIGIRANQEITLVIRRGSQTKALNLTVGEEPSYGAGVIGVGMPMAPIIDRIASGRPADRAGLLNGDVVLSIDGREIADWMQLRDAIVGCDGKQLIMRIKRGAEVLSVDILPELNEQTDSYAIGIAAPGNRSKIVKYPFGTALFKGTERLISTMELTFTTLRRLFVGQVSVKSLGGPIMIARISGQHAREGTTPLLQLIAFLSIQLFILNLLPIPVLDGGHVLFLGIESVIRRPVSMKFKEHSTRVGFALLIGFMLFVSYNDVLKLLN